MCSGSIYLLVGSRERWEVVRKEKLMDFQGLFLPPTLVQLTIRRTFFTMCSSYLFCQCQLIKLSHFLSCLPGKMENSKSLHRCCQTDWIGGKMVMFFVRTEFKLLANLKPRVRCWDDFLKSLFFLEHPPPPRLCWTDDKSLSVCTASVALRTFSISTQSSPKARQENNLVFPIIW